MLSALMVSWLLASPTPKPVIPVITAQAMKGRTPGPELIQGKKNPVLVQSGDRPATWLAVEVWATVTLEPETEKDSEVELAVTQGAKKHVFKAQQFDLADTDLTPFFVPIYGCEPMVFEVTVGGQRKSSATLLIKCS